jgi:hypothetical protein
MAHPEAQVFAEHLDTIRDRDNVVKMATFLQNLRAADKMVQQSIVLWLSPDCLEHTVWKKCISSLINHKLISSFICDECHYIPTDGRFFRKQFHTSVRNLVAQLWDNCPMLFCSATFNRPLEYHTSLMLHPAGLGNNNNGVPLLFGLDGDDIVVPQDLNFGLPTPFFTHSIRGTLGRSGINISIGFSSDWKSALKGAVGYIRSGLKVMVYCQSAELAADKVKPFCQLFLSDLGFQDQDAVSLTGNDGIMMKAFLVDIFSGKITSDVCDLAMIAGTSAMKCGISSNLLHYILHVGFPPRPSEMIQTLGRLCRGPQPRTRQECFRSAGNSYIVFVSRMKECFDKLSDPTLSRIRLNLCVSVLITKVMRSLSDKPTIS